MVFRSVTWCVIRVLHVWDLKDTFVNAIPWVDRGLIGVSFREGELILNRIDWCYRIKDSVSLRLLGDIRRTHLAGLTSSVSTVTRSTIMLRPLSSRLSWCTTPVLASVWVSVWVLVRCFKESFTRVRVKLSLFSFTILLIALEAKILDNITSNAKIDIYDIVVPIIFTKIGKSFEATSKRLWLFESIVIFVIIAKISESFEATCSKTAEGISSCRLVTTALLIVAKAWILVL